MKLSVICALLAAGCSAPPHPEKVKTLYRLQHQEKSIGTLGQDNWLFHRLAEDHFGLGLKFPGYLIGIEKSEQDIIGVDNDVFDFSKSPFRRQTSGGRTRDKLQRILHTDGSGRRAFISHILAYDLERKSIARVRGEFLYNIYDVPGASDYRADKEARSRVLSENSRNAFRKGLDAIGETSRFARHLKRQIQELGVTHILLYCMGWNTEQEEAIRNFNSQAGYLFAIAPPERFRPLVIGVTWDSVSGKNSVRRALSYFGKSKDADEIGAVWLNALLRRAIIPAKLAHPHVKLVVLGHSFGARAVSLGLVSHPILREPLTVPVEPGHVDLMIGLQAAFSVNRFLPGQGDEGSPLKTFRSVAQKFVLTWSINDTANPIARPVTGAAHAGGWPGVEQASAFPEFFECRTWEHDGWQDGRAPSRRPAEESLVSMVDVSSIVRYRTHNKGGKAHSDIFSREMATLIWDLIDRFTGAEPPDGGSGADGSGCIPLPWEQASTE